AGRRAGGVSALYPGAVSVVSVQPEDIHRLSVDDVLGMVDAGVLDETARVELWDGVLVDMSPEGDQHVEAVRRLNETLVLAYSGSASVYVQSTMRFSTEHEFRQPDLAVVLDPAYRGAPRGRDTALVVEIAHSSQLRDRRKLAFYAAEGVGEVWLVDLVRGVV